VKQISYVESKSFSYVVALRRSGFFDLYWNYQKKFSSDGLNISALEVGLTFETFYFKLIDDQGKNSYHKIDHK